MASVVYAEITYIVLIHMSQGQTGQLPYITCKKLVFEPLIGAILMSHA